MSLTFEDTNLMVEELWQKFDLFEEAENAVKFFGETGIESSYEDWDAGSLEDDILLSNCDRDILTGTYYDEEINADKFLLRDCMWSGRCVDDANNKFGINATPNVVIKKEIVSEPKKPQTISKSDSVLLNNIKKTCNEQRINTNKNQLKSVQPGRSLLLRSRYNTNNISNNTNKQTTTNLLPVNQGFNSLNLLQVLKQVEDDDNFDGIDKKFNMFPSPPDSSEENENDDCENKKKILNKNTKNNNLNDFINNKIVKKEIEIKKEKSDDFDLFNKKLFSLSDSEDSNLDFENDMFSDNEVFTFKPFYGFEETKIKKELDSSDEACQFGFNNKFKAKIKSEPITPTKSESRIKQEPRIVRNNPCETDHCYSLLKYESVREKSLDRNMIGMLGVQTPSDSEEEEIDVVSLGVSQNQIESGYYSTNGTFSGKANLPTCPSKQDRKQLQLEVNRKISESNNRLNNGITSRKPNAIPESQIVKQPGGLKTLVPRSRPSYNNSSRDESDDEYEMHISKSRNTSSKLNRKRKRDKSASSDDEYDLDYSLSQEFSSSTAESSTSSSQHKPLKKRGRKRRCDDDNIWNNHNGAERSSRSAHNDMERRRRVGLRVLFEELRQAVPQLSCREKAPKVSILREASALCRELRERDEEMKRQRREQKRLLERVRELRRELAFTRG